MPTRQSCLPLTLCCVAVAALVPFSLGAEPEPLRYSEHQVIESAERVTSLGTTGKHGWWVSFEAVDPALLTAELLRGEPERGAQRPPGPKWYPVRVPAYLTQLPQYERGHKEMWYVKVLRIPSRLPPALSVRLGKINDRDRAYFNGRLIGSTGVWDARPAQAYDLVRVYEIPVATVRPGALNVLLVHVRGFTDLEDGITRDRLEIGPTPLLHRAVLHEAYFEIIFLISFLTAGAYFLFLFLRRRVERENLLFGLFILSLVAYQFLKTQLRFELPISFLEAKRLEYLVLYPLVPLFYFFLRHYYELPRGRLLLWWDRFLWLPLAVIVACWLHVLVTGDANRWWDAQRLVGQPTWIFFIVGMIGILVSRVRVGNRDAFYMLAALLVILVGMVLDVLASRGHINLASVFTFFFAAFVLSLALILANRFVRINKEVEDLNLNLEQKVRERTDRLNRSLEEVRALKEQQDGDYFLTSLLIQPLAGNHSRGSGALFEMFEKQKKAFRFRRWESEIGGDLLVAYDVVLRGRRYAVFLNGDAMGKSMQGAGGALVVGTVFKSVVARMSAGADADRYPEQWLKECFLQLQGVFVSFSGSMMLSAVIGLVDDENGMLYYINAEHPPVVLFRDGHARFLEDETQLLRKIGIEAVEGQLRVFTLRLVPGDVFFVGSDGRDDLLIGETAEGKRMINEDHTLFLRAIERTAGELRLLVDEIFRSGSQTDDLTLLRLSFREDAAVPETAKPPDGFAAALAQADEYEQSGQLQEARDAVERALGLFSRPDVRVRLAGLERKLHNYSAAADLYIQASEEVPENTKVILRASGCLRLCGRLTEAAEMGERVRLRNPEDARNLLHLADCYRRLRQEARARMLLELARGLAPDLPALHELAARLN